MKKNQIIFIVAFTFISTVSCSQKLTQEKVEQLTQNLDSSQFCDECGDSLQKYVAPEGSSAPINDVSNSESQNQEVPVFQSASVTSIGVPSIVEEKESERQLKPSRRPETTGRRFIKKQHYHSQAAGRCRRGSQRGNACRSGRSAPRQDLWPACSRQGRT